MSDLDKLCNAIYRARINFEVELLKQYPIGSKVYFKISTTQRKHSSGLVMRAGYKPGYLSVKHLEAKQHSRYSHREVYYSDILAATGAA